MTIVGITGHSNLSGDSYPTVRHALLDHLGPLRDDLIGMSCIARGPDQIFADLVLELGGTLDVVLPAADYLSGIPDPVDRERCDGYLAAARTTVTMPFETSGAPAYLAASRYLIDRCDVLMAVWDGAPPTGSGGTAEAVGYARERGVAVTVVWPPGARRR
ncbi:hypothetical protein [Pseudonocardia kunmingensis]|uniref:Uncharacterized protein n=1 Tax=Pseudonocardia kunmingensis TaxID=630975 RepID=A0A543DLJ4_9PSEU|nr:hypothetical protein [Pseudonocardia kunmingensis]TQM10189.1 hypothetical protein FB558_5973 [Pseudonocardia kunmingensis]